MRTGDCPFCGDKGVQIDREHAVPVWLRDLILKRKQSPDEMLTIHVGGDTPRPYRTRDANTRVHCACKNRCNGGWMSKLESRAKPILRPMVEARSSITIPVGEQQCAEIAFWLLKTAMIWDFFGGGTPYFTDSERRMVVAHQLAFPILMWLGRYTGAGHFMAMHTPLGLKSADQMVEGFAFTLSAGHLVTQFLTYRPAPGLGEVVVQVPGTPPEELVSVWPPRRILWPPVRSISTSERLLSHRGTVLPPRTRGDAIGEAPQSGREVYGTNLTRTAATFAPV